MPVDLRAKGGDSPGRHLWRRADVASETKKKAAPKGGLGF
jgi:hypothetical protein